MRKTVQFYHDIVIIICPKKNVTHFDWPMGVVWYETFVKANCFQREMQFLSSPLHQRLFVACRDIRITMWQSHANFPLCKRNHSMSRSQKQFIEVRASSTNEITESCERSQSKGDRVKQMQFYLFRQRDGAIQTRRSTNKNYFFPNCTVAPRCIARGADLLICYWRKWQSASGGWGWGSKKINSNNNQTQRARWKSEWIQFSCCKRALSIDCSGVDS